ncbi:MAG: HAMP domain-containing protein [Acidobacteriota bacterium]|nr:HAMP domain-containing protein [Acidobacteriota bacterium]
MLVLALVSFGVPLAVSLRDRVKAEVYSQARSQADVVAATSADLVTPSSAAQLNALVRSSASTVRGRVLVVNARGAVLADSAGPSTLGRSYASRPEIGRALGGTGVQTQRVSRSLGEEILATAVPVVRHGAVVGAVRVTQSIAAVQRAIDATVAKLALVGGTVLVLGLLAGGLIARQVARPLRRLETAAKGIQGGDFSARAPVEGSSEQRSLSIAFNDMAGRIESLLRAQRDFVADASHQLRTPLTALRLRLEEAHAGGVSAAVGAELDAATVEVDRLAGIVNELLLLGQAEGREPAGEPLDLAGVVARAAERWRPEAQARGIAIETLDEGARPVTCRRADLDRALDALIENALHYSPSGSTVTLSSVDRRIEVGDRGPGLGAGEEDLVFERFHRGGVGREATQGSGLGLPIARALARAWHGDARLGNREGGGALARLEFPGGGS